MKRNLEFRKKTYFKKHLFINVQQNILSRTITMEWLRDATDALEEEDSLLNKGLDNSFLNNNVLTGLDLKLQEADFLSGK